jgi:hypothetical protein
MPRVWREAVNGEKSRTPTREPAKRGFQHSFMKAVISLGDAERRKVVIADLPAGRGCRDQFS